MTAGEAIESLAGFFAAALDVFAVFRVQAVAGMGFGLVDATLDLFLVLDGLFAGQAPEAGEPAHDEPFLFQRPKPNKKCGAPDGDMRSLPTRCPGPSHRSGMGRSY